MFKILAILILPLICLSCASSNAPTSNPNRYLGGSWESAYPIGSPERAKDISRKIKEDLAEDAANAPFTKEELVKRDFGPKPSDAKALELLKKWGEVRVRNSHAAKYKILMSPKKSVDTDTGKIGWMFEAAINDIQTDLYIIRPNGELEHFMDKTAIGF